MSKRKRPLKRGASMKYMYLVPLVSLICVVFCGSMAYHERVQSHLYKALERNEREMLEGFLRTSSGKIESAYICRSKK